MKRIVIVGGGITGLACAYALRHRARVTLLEASARLGGVIATERREGFMVEHGPDGFLASKPEAARLCSELGIETEPIRTRGAFVLVRGRLRALVAGAGMSLPTRAWAFARSDLVSPWGKVRMLLDLVLPRGPDREDESLASFVRRRLGREALEAVAEPLLAGIHAALAERLSVRAAFPQLLEIERSHRSLLLGLRRSSAAGGQGALRAPRSGMGGFVERVAGALSNVCIRMDAPVRRIEPGWRVHTEAQIFDADEVVLALPAPAAAALVGRFAASLRDALAGIHYTHTTTVSLGFRGRAPLAGSGFMVARRERRRIAGCTWASEKFEGRAPPGRWLARCSLRGAPADPARIARDELRDILALDEDPVLEAPCPAPAPRPLYELGHVRRVRRVEELTPPGLHVIGSAYRGAGVPDCIRDAQRAAVRIDP
ncbi:MAG: protoporphyrinogen oxidase [Planctomycetes bacterium]|nr:protoporphyrinogen oxidase [Planctomycetota bacterium]